MQQKIKILLIRNDHIGDLICSTPIFREIKRELPNSEITLIVSKLNKPVIEKNPNIDKIIELDIPQHNFSTIIDYMKMAFILRKEKFDYGIDLRGSFMNSFFLLYLARIKNKIAGIDFHPIIRIFLNKPIVLGKKQHILEDNKKLLKKGMGIDIKNNWPEIITDEKDKKEAKLFTKKNNIKKYICVCPIAGLDYKQWKLENFKNILIWLNKEYSNYKILLFGISKDKKIIKDLAKYNKNSIEVYDFNLRQMGLIFNQSKLVITQDGGPMHIAWITKSPLLALFPADTDKFMPLKNWKTFVSKSKGNMKSIYIEEIKKATSKKLK